MVLQSLYSCLSACSQDVVSFIEIEKKKCKEKKNAPVGARIELPAPYALLIVVFPCHHPCLSSAFVGVAVAGVIWVAGIVVVVVGHCQ